MWPGASVQACWLDDQEPLFQETPDGTVSLCPIATPPQTDRMGPFCKGLAVQISALREGAPHSAASSR